MRWSYSNLTKLFFALLCFGLIAAAVPSKYPKDYFGLPVDIRMYLSGTFGELRSNHFHAGIDIKTNQQVGLPIYASASGYISRIKVSPYGYGNALYMTHPNGYTSVYAHLQKFEEGITAYVKKEQYRQKSFSVNLFPPKDRFYYEKGDQIALSGNSGGSGGPHLHFEIRNSAEVPINPFHFGIEVFDNIKPWIRSVIVYPKGKYKYVSDAKRYEGVSGGTGYRLKQDTLVVNATSVAFGIEATDQLNGASNRNGAYLVELNANGEQIYQFRAEKIGFDETRYLNSLVDYELAKTLRKKVYKCYREPGNMLKAIKAGTSNGLLTLTDKATKVEGRVVDFAGNESKVSFWIKSDPASTTFKVKRRDVDEIFCHNVANYFSTDLVKMSLPSRVLFDTVYFDYQLDSTVKQGAISMTHQVHHYRVPLFKHYSLAIKAPDLSQELQKKALVVYEGKPGSKSAKGGTYENGFITARVREFGNFYLAVDTVPPKIKGLNIYNNKKMTAFSSIRLKVTDNLAGIENYSAYIDDQWVLLQFDAKRNLMYHEFDERTAAGEHRFKVVVTDERGNKAEEEFAFHR